MEKLFPESYTEVETGAESSAFEVVSISDITALGKAERAIADIARAAGGESWRIFSRPSFERAANAIVPRFSKLEFEDREKSGNKRGQVRRAESWLSQVFERTLVFNPALSAFFNHPEFCKVIEERSDGEIPCRDLQGMIRGAMSVEGYVRERRKKGNVSIGSNVLLDALNKVDLVEIERNGREGNFMVLLTQIKTGAISPEETETVHAAHQSYTKERFAAMENLNIKRAADLLSRLVKAAEGKEEQDFLECHAVRFQHENLWSAFAEFVDNTGSYSRQSVEKKLESSGVPFSYFLAFLKSPDSLFEKTLERIDSLFKGRFEELRQWAKTEPQTADEILALHNVLFPNSILTAEHFISRIVSNGAVVSERKID